MKLEKLLVVSMLVVACSKGGNAPSTGSASLSPTEQAKAQEHQLAVGSKADSNYPLDKYLAITSPEQMGYIYLGLTGEKQDNNTLLNLFAPGYWSVLDAFKKHDIEQVEMPKILAQIDHYRAEKPQYISFVGDVAFKTYDFNTQSFELQNNMWSLGGVRIRPTMGDQTQYSFNTKLKVPDSNQAKLIERGAPRKATYYFHVIGTQAAADRLENKLASRTNQDNRGFRSVSINLGDIIVELVHIKLDVTSGPQGQSFTVQQ